MTTPVKADHIETYRRRMRLEEYYDQAQAIILSRQNPITGLLPASTAITIHGDYTHAWVRDNVYSILAIWGLAMAYRREDSDQGRAYELEQSVVKLMRGMLVCMMKQSAKVEAFKHTLDPKDALHAKYDTQTGEPVVGDDEWGHLQLDATSLFLLILAQMIASGLRIIFDQEEVDFVQNLVHYISRTYLTPDFGLWERGAKMNAGDAEINSSSVGMAKAALEAMRGFDLYGGEGSDASVIHVVEDDIANARDTLETLLPRESESKEIDAALLSIIGFPAFAVENTELVTQTRQEIVTKLQGRYGCKRFLRDGHQTVLEDPHRPYYEQGELQAFEHIESEWPLFFTYQLLDGLMREDAAQVEFYRAALEPLFVEQDGRRLLPELYFVARENVAAEKAAPNSQDRVPNENVPLVWAQSLHMLGSLLLDKYIYAADIDPLDRRWGHRYRRETMVNLAFLAADAEVQVMLDEQGIHAQTPAQIAPVRAAKPSDLVEAYGEVGRNRKLSLSGRPKGRFDTLTTSQAFSVRGETVVFLPPFLDARKSYLHLDNRLLVEQIKGELAYLQRNWRQPGRPLMTLMVSRSMLLTGNSRLLVDLLKDMQEGLCNGVKVRVSRIAEHLYNAARQSIDYLHDFQLQDATYLEGDMVSCTLKLDANGGERISGHQIGVWRTEPSAEILLSQLQESRNSYAQVELLGILWGRLDVDAPTSLGASLRDMAEELYGRAGERRAWGVLRRAAALLGWCDERLEDEVARIVVRRMRLAVGRSFSSAVLIERPLNTQDILARINTYGGDDPRGRLLIQEIVLLLGKLVKIDPEAFQNTSTLQCWHLLLLLVGELAWERQITQDEAFDELMELSPQEIMERLHRLLRHAGQGAEHLATVESLQIASSKDGLATITFTADSDPKLGDAETGWTAWRKINGAVPRLSKAFFRQLWQDLGQCAGLVIGDRLESHNRLNSKLLRADMTAGEKSFARLIEDKLNHIHAPEYRQLVIEALQVFSRILRVNPDLQLDSHVVLDVLIGHAVRIHWTERPEPQGPYSENGAAAWELFYEAPPHEVANAIVAAFEFLVAEIKESQAVAAEQSEAESG